MLPDMLYGSATDDQYYTPQDLEFFQRERERSARIPGTSLEDIGRMVPTPASILTPGIEQQQAFANQQQVAEMRKRRQAVELEQARKAIGPLAQAGANIFGGLMDGTGMAARGVVGAIPSVGRMPIDFRMPTDSPSDPAGQMGLDAADAAPMFQSAAPQQARVEVVGGGGPDYKALRDQRMGQTESELSGIRMRDNLVRARRELAQRNQNPDTTPLSNEAVQNLAVEDKQRKAAERLMQDQERAQYMERLLPPETQVYLSEMRQQEQVKQFLEGRKMQTEERKVAALERVSDTKGVLNLSNADKSQAQTLAETLLAPRRGAEIDSRTGLNVERAQNIPREQALRERIGESTIGLNESRSNRIDSMLASEIRSINAQAALYEARGQAVPKELQIRMDLARSSIDLNAAKGDELRTLTPERANKMRSESLLTDAKTGRTQALLPRELANLDARTGLTLAQTETEGQRSEIEQARLALEGRKIDEQKRRNDAYILLTEATSEQQRASAKKAVREADAVLAKTNAVDAVLAEPSDSRYMNDPEYKNLADEKSILAKIIRNPRAEAKRKATAEERLLEISNAMATIRSRSDKKIFDRRAGTIRPVGAVDPVATGNPMMDTINALPMGYEDLVETNRAFGVN
jgi:hypothetical protein